MNAGIDVNKITEQQHQLATKSEASPVIPNSSFVPAAVNCERFEAVDNHLHSVDDSSQLNCTNVLSNSDEARNSIEEVEKQPQNVPDVTIDNLKSEFSTDQHVSTSLQEPSNVHDSSNNCAADSIETEATEESTDINESIAETTSSESSDDSDSLTCDERTSDPEVGNRIVDDSMELRTGDESLEMRTELSSVVPPTSMSLEITATHETDTALPETVNVESNEIVAKEAISQIENEALESQDVDEHVNVEDQSNVEPVEPNNTPADQSQDRFIKPISFETAATMDDVSDTELESYLQELEDMEENSMEKPKTDTIKNPIKLEDVETFGSDGIFNVTNTFENASEIIGQIASRDDRNADSFSQASTVEFGEVNAISSNEPISNANPNIESVQSVESVVDAEPTVEMSEQIQHETLDNEADGDANAHIDGTDELADSLNEREAELSSDLDNHTECSECELDQLASGGTAAAAKRPNSLNLQNCNSTLIDSQQNPSNFDENAGNTPAACGQFLSSSISSDDSNIAAEANQIVSDANLTI